MDNSGDIIRAAWEHYKPAHIDALRAGDTLMADSGFTGIMEQLHLALGSN